MSVDLATGRARELAAEWAQWRAVVDRLGESSEAAKWHKMKASDRDRLLAWVKARMAAVDSDSLSQRDDMVMAVATDLGLLHPSGLPLAIARDLCDLAVPS